MAARLTHFVDQYADVINHLLHLVGGARFFRQEIVEVPGLLTGLIITYDDVRDDSRETHDQMSYDDFLSRMTKVKPDWKHFGRENFEKLKTKPEKMILGWEGRTIYFLRGGSEALRWTTENAETDALILLAGSHAMLGPLIQLEVNQLKRSIPPGREHFRDYENMVRIIFRYLFRSELGEGKAQSRTAPENEGVEIRDVIFANLANSGFWKDLKDKYSASEIVVDAKNTENLTREDLRQLYCYLKPALGFWGFIVCRTPPSEAIRAFNRTLCKNFRQERGVLILDDDDLRRMVEIAKRGNSPTSYLQERMSEFVRSL